MIAFRAKKKIYEADVVKRDQAKAAIAVEKGKHTQDVVFNSILIGLHACLVKITGKIKSAARESVAIVDKLKMTTTLDTTGEVILDPYGTSNLSGIVQCLYNSYSKPSFVVFSRKLLELISDSEKLEVCTKTPMVAVGHIQDKLKQWRQLDLWKFMTLDIMFTVSFVRALHIKSDLRSKASYHMSEYIAKHKNDDIDGVEFDDNSMPMFDDMCAWIQDVYKESKDFDASGNAASGQTEEQQGQHAEQKNNGNSGGGKKQRQRAEQAAAAAQSNVKMAKGPYSREVTNSEQVFVINHQYGSQQIYIALHKACELCSKVTKATPKANRVHNPVCYSGACVKCGMFGHGHANCLQDMRKGSEGFAAKESESV
jgi:hypothetical protein